MLLDPLLLAIIEQKLHGSFFPGGREGEKEATVRGRGCSVCGRVKKREGEIIKSICGNLKFQPGLHQQRVHVICALSFPATQESSIQTHLPDKS
jgi:hypothetical protein